MRIWKTYISGKISGRPIEEARDQFRQAAQLYQEWLSRQLPKHYEMIFNPLEHGLPADELWEEHMAFDIVNMLECETIVMLPGWEESSGAKIEHAIAIRKRKRIYYQVGADFLTYNEYHEKNH